MPKAAIQIHIPKAKNDGFTREKKPFLAQFDITDIGGKELIPKIHSNFLRCRIPDGSDPLKKGWEPLLDNSIPNRICCITASKGIASILEGMEAKRIPIPPEKKHSLLSRGKNK